MYRLLLSLASRVPATNEGWDLEEQKLSFLAPQKEMIKCARFQKFLSLVEPSCSQWCAELQHQ